jgi:hypothetical protein
MEGEHTIIGKIPRERLEMAVAIRMAGSAPKAAAC